MEEAAGGETGAPENEAMKLKTDKEGALEAHEEKAGAKKEATVGESDDNDESVASASEGLRESGAISPGRGEEEQGEGSEMDKLAVLRREKRLAMNRESARNRRKRKKVLLQHLEARNDELSKANQQYQLANESLAAKVRALENELAMARTALTQLTASATSQPGQQRFVGHPGNAAFAARQSVGNNEFDQYQRSGNHPVSTEAASRDSNLGRLMQAQLEHLAMQGGTSAGIPFASAAGQGAGGGAAHFSDDPVLRRHALDIHALSQASRDNALGSMMNVSSFAPNVSGDRNQHSSYRGVPEAASGVQGDSFQNVQNVVRYCIACSLS